jgi:hypothetical protein
LVACGWTIAGVELVAGGPDAGGTGGD